MKTSSILDTYQTWLTHREYSPATIQKYTKALARFFADTGAGDIPTRETVAAWRDSLTEKGYTPATVNAMLAAVNDCQESIDNVAGKAMLCKEGYADVLFELGNRMSPLQSVEYCDNRLARFVASKGKCEITGKLLSVNEVHCHHFLPRHLGGTDQYSNLRIVHVDVHRLIHATTPESIQFYLRKTGCYKKPCLDKINRWRASANLPAITL